jgi:hypothetical protein
VPEDYIIQRGDCLHSIAMDCGVSWQKIWDHPENSTLKSLRKDPNILKEGDNLYLPDPEVREESGGTDQNHGFTLKGFAVVLNLRILDYEFEQTRSSPRPPASPGARHVTEDDPEPVPVKQKAVPRANVPFTLEIDGNVISGNTDNDGVINQNIPPNARQGTLTIEPGTQNEMVIPLQLGALDPVSEISGVKHRLSNLGFICGDPTDEMTPEFEEALCQFQQWNDIQVTGQPDAATKGKLKQLHGS